MKPHSELYAETPTIIMENGVPFHAHVIGLPFFRICKHDAEEKAQPKMKISIP